MNRPLAHAAGTGAAPRQRYPARMNVTVTVGDVMTAEPSTVTPETTVGEVYGLMKANHFGHVPVVSEGRLLGIVTMTDIGALGAAIPEVRERKVGDVMTRDLITISPEERVEVATAKMASRKIHCLLVVEGGRLVGIVTTFDLLDALMGAVRSVR
jgi:CBS domain-containing protein